MMKIPTLGLLACLACRAPESTGPEASAGALLEEGRAANEAGDQGRAERIYSEVIERSPRSAEGYKWRGHTRNLAGRYEAAIADYDHALALEPDHAWTWYARGMSKNNLGRRSDAIADYSRAIALDPEHVKAWSWRGFTLQQLGDHEAAVRDLDRVLELDARDAWARTTRAQSLRAMGRLMDAFDDTLIAFQQGGDRDAALARQLGFLAFALGKDDETRHDLVLGEQLDAGTDPHARLLLWYLERRGEAAAADRALGEFFVAYRQRPDHEPWPCEVAACLLGSKSWDELQAKAEATTEAIERRTRLCELAFYRGLKALSDQRVEEARTLMRAALATGATDTFEHAAAKRLAGDEADDRK